MIVDRRIYWVVRQFPDKYDSIHYPTESQAQEMLVLWRKARINCKVIRVSVIIDETKVREVVDASDH